MNTLSIKENCKELKNRLKQQFPMISDEDLDCKNGQQKEKMYENLQQKLRQNQEELHDLLYHLWTKQQSL